VKNRGGDATARNASRVRVAGLAALLVTTSCASKEGSPGVDLGVIRDRMESSSGARLISARGGCDLALPNRANEDAHWMSLGRGIADMRRPAIVVALLVLGACSSSGSTAATQRPLRTTESVNAAVLPALVGKWELKR